MHMINKFTTLNKKVHRGDTYYIDYPSICFWLKNWFPGYSFTIDTYNTDNTITVNIYKVLSDDDMENKETHVACSRIPIVFIMYNNEYKIRQVIQDAIYGR